MKAPIVIRGAATNNLKQIDLDIPKEQLVVFTGVSGSGKTSLVFDTIAAEASRCLADCFPAHLRARMALQKAPEAAQLDNLSTAVVIRQRPGTGNARSTVGTILDAAPLLRLLYSRCAVPALASSSCYSFNDPAGMCPDCSGLGYTVEFDLGRILDRSRSLNGGAIRFPGHQPGACLWQVYANSGLYDPDVPLKDYTPQQWHDFLHGSGLTVTIRNTTGKVWGDSYQQTYEGFQDRIERLYLHKNTNSLSKAHQAILDTYTHHIPCPRCKGARLNKATLQSRLLGRSIADAGALELSELPAFLAGVESPAGRAVVEKLVPILLRAKQIGLGYLTLDRPSDSLSGGEMQRLKLVRQLGSGLVDLTYIFDEPTAGLHPRDAARLIPLLHALRDRHNSVLVVEHEPQLIHAADQVIELGPRSGAEGGRVIFQGTLPELLTQDTPTANALRRAPEYRAAPRPWTRAIHVQDAATHNLKHLTLDVPLGCLVAVTGVAGSGKSSLVCGELPRYVPDAVCIEQSPIGISSRSNPATYLGVADSIRALVGREAGLPASKLARFGAGACPVCRGRGTILTDMAFMDPVEIPCERCGGHGYNETALSARYRGKSILEILALSADEAVRFFAAQAKICVRLRLLQEVGLGYLTLAQPTSTLSGGECQRLKLASHLSRQGCVFLMDEPAAGLHEQDVALLLSLLQRLVDGGNSVIVAEHHPAIIRQADWVIDLGPEGGRDGGSLLFEGPPAALRHCPNSYTAQYLDGPPTAPDESRRTCHASEI